MYCGCTVLVDMGVLWVYSTSEYAYMYMYVYTVACAVCCATLCSTHSCLLCVFMSCVL